MNQADNYIDINRKLWNERAKVHAKSEFYDFAGFRGGKTSLNRIELEELGDVKGKKLLHLQCHFGQDTISWAREGAEVTGVDFSDEAISMAQKLAREEGINAEFICCDIYDLKNHLHEKFDIVFTSYGVIGWLPDMEKWAGIVAHYLKPGGVFYMAEFHPVVWMFDNGFTKFGNSYFKGDAIIETVTKTYTDGGAHAEATEIGWNHSLGEVISALTKQGLQIEFLHEFPYSVYNCFANTVQGADGLWRIKGLENIIPMMYSVKATKP